MKRNYSPPTFFTRDGIPFAEFADGTLYGIREYPRMTRDGTVLIRRTFIRITEPCDA